MGTLLSLAQEHREVVLPILESNILPLLRLNEVQKRWMLVNTAMHDLVVDCGYYWHDLFISSRYSLGTLVTEPLRYETTNQTWRVHDQFLRIPHLKTMKIYPTCLEASLMVFLSKIGKHVNHLGIEMDKLEFSPAQVVRILSHTPNLMSFHLLGATVSIEEILTALVKASGDTLTTLSIIDFTNSNEGVFEKMIPQFKALRNINIQTGERTLTGTFVADMEQLQKYILLCSSIPDAQISSIFDKNGKQIQKFFFHSETSQNTIIDCLNKAPKLTELGLATVLDSHVMSANPNIASLFSRITHLTLDNVTSDKKLKDIFWNDINYTQLTSLAFTQSSNFNSVLPSIAPKWSEVVELDVGTVTDLNETGLQQICQSCPKLQVLRIPTLNSALAYLPTRCCDIRVVDVFEAYGRSNNTTAFSDQCDIIAVLYFIFTHRTTLYRLRETNEEPQYMKLLRGLDTIYSIYIGSVTSGTAQRATDDAKKFAQIDNYLKEKRTQKEFRVLTEHGQIWEVEACRYLKSILRPPA